MDLSTWFGILVKKHFAEVAVSHAEKEKDNGRWEYDVLLSDGTH